MLLPALLGYFMNKNTKLDRFDVVQKSQVIKYFAMSRSLVVMLAVCVL